MRTRKKEGNRSGVDQPTDRFFCRLAADPHAGGSATVQDGEYTDANSREADEYFVRSRDIVYGSLSGPRADGYVANGRCKTGPNIIKARKEAETRT